MSTMTRLSQVDTDGSLRKLIRRTYGVHRLEEMGRRLAKEIHASSQAVGPPFNPREFARWLGIAIVSDDIDAEGMFIEGNIQRERGGVSRSLAVDRYRVTSPMIVLKSRVGGSARCAAMRERFTVAHELGHYSIRKAFSETPHAGLFTGRDPEEEMLCNSFAEELLVPRLRLSRDLRGGEINCATVLELSEKYQVSLTCMLCCISKLFRGAVAAVIWKQDRWLTVHWSSPKSYRDLLLCDTGSTSVELALRNADEHSGVDHFLLNGTRLKWRSSSQRLPESTLVLSILKRSHDRLRRYVDVRPQANMSKQKPIQESFNFTRFLEL